MSQLVTPGSDGVVPLDAPFVAPLTVSVRVEPTPATPSLALVQTGPVPVRRRDDRGLVSAEWAMAIIAAVAIVGVLVAVIGSGAVKTVLLNLIKAIIAGALTHI